MIQYMIQFKRLGMHPCCICMYTHVKATKWTQTCPLIDCHCFSLTNQLILLGRMDLSPAPDWLRTMSSVMSYLDCGLNPLIYCSHQDFREAGLALLWTNRKPSTEPVLTAVTKLDLWTCETHLFSEMSRGDDTAASEISLQSLSYVSLDLRESISYILYIL